jgi:SAM-dependent methyltransferase
MHAAIAHPREADDAVTAAHQFVSLLAALDRGGRRQRRSVPTLQERRVLLDGFWDGLVAALRRAEGSLGEAELPRAREDVRAVLMPWLLRRRLWNRSYVKPHGFAGDFRIVEWMYELETDPCADPTEPLVVNLLDGLFKSVHCVKALWDRRAWFAHLIATRMGRGAAPVCVLDVACGGGRYVRDVMDKHPSSGVRATFVDQDSTALAFVASWLPPSALATSRLVCAPVRRLAELVPGRGAHALGSFEIVMSTGVFDYLDDASARSLLAQMAAVTRPGGTLAICNFGPEDGSRIVKDWIVDWRLTYRTRDQLRLLFPETMSPSVTRSPDGGLHYAYAIRRD